MTKKTILLTNDDGILSLGIQQLKEHLTADGNYDVYVVAPDRERSGISMSLTINRPLRLTRLSDRDVAVSGTPADCVNVALQKILPHWPDFIISGMNEGENLCEDVFFSGTVAGAFTGHMYGIPALAVSLLASKDGGFDFEKGARIAGRVLESLLPLHNTDVVYNLNIPSNAADEKNVVVTYPGFKRYKPSIVERVDPRGRRYYWIGTGSPDVNGDNGSDLHAVENGNVSLSVLRYDLKDTAEMKKLEEVFG
jgi:5'-nucleotidase